MTLAKFPVIGIVALLMCGHSMTAPRPCLSAATQEFVLQEISVSAIVIDNNRIIPEPVVRELTSPCLNRRISYIDLELLRNSLTTWLIDHGYINSGVVIPDQELSGNSVHLAVVEGELTSIKTEGNRYFSNKYFTGKIAQHIGPPFRLNDLQEAFQLLYQDRQITSINAELAAGVTPGEAALTLRVTEASPWQASVLASNDSAPSIGSYRGGVMLAHRNLSGIGDTLEGTAGGSEGGYDYGARYQLPFTYSDSRLDLYFRRSAAKVIDPEFKPLDIKSSSGTYGARISHPLTRTVRREIRPSLALEYRESQNYLLGEGFSFSEHETDGKSTFSVARAGLEWVERSDGSVLVASGIINSGITDEHFVSLLGRLLRMQRTGLAGSLLHIRGEAQLTGSGLAPLEKYALGGISSVRGYRKNVLVKDNALTGSLEWWFPLFRDSAGNEFFSLAPFADYGRGWDHGAGETAQDLASVGIGCRLTGKGVSLELFYGYALKDSGVRKIGDPQEHGVHFNATWNIL